MTDAALLDELRASVNAACGARGRCFPGARDRLTAIGVGEVGKSFMPPYSHRELKRRMLANYEAEYGGILTSILIAIIIDVIAGFVANAILAWWKKHHPSRELLASLAGKMRSGG
jgi:hypothetical protein